jgi:hypothetical protein
MQMQMQMQMQMKMQMQSACWEQQGYHVRVNNLWQ